MVNTEHGLYRGVGGCTKQWFSVVFTANSLIEVIPLLLFGCCTLRVGKHGFSCFGCVEIPKLG